MRKKLLGICAAFAALVGMSILSLVAINEPENLVAASGLKFFAIAVVGLSVATVWTPVSLYSRAFDIDRLKSEREKSFSALKDRAKSFITYATSGQILINLLARLILVVGLISTGAVWLAVFVTFAAFVRHGVSKILQKVAKESVTLDNYHGS